VVIIARVVILFVQLVLLPLLSSIVVVGPAVDDKGVNAVLAIVVITAIGVDNRCGCYYNGALDRYLFASPAFAWASLAFVCIGYACSRSALEQHHNQRQLPRFMGPEAFTKREGTRRKDQ
jgi:hypothetical protein